MEDLSAIAYSKQGSQIVPHLLEEASLWQEGVQHVAGIDEVGRGPLAGPLAVAVVVLPPWPEFSWLGQVRDSKLLTPKAREELAQDIRRDALAVAVGMVDAPQIDSLGLTEATRQAAYRALEGLPISPQHLLIDGTGIGLRQWPQKAIINGDGLCISIAAASIVAKVARDRLMIEADAVFPGYGFARHKGYGTPEHLQALASLGPCPLHRRSFAPVRALCSPEST